MPPGPFSGRGELLDPSNHQLATRAALGRLPAKYPLLGWQLDLIVSANYLSDADLTSSSVHFDNCAFSEGSAHIARRWDIITSEKDRFSPRSLQAFGELLHTTQDFYSHSNWIELHADRSPIPVWDLEPGSLPAGIVSGTVHQSSPKRCAEGAPGHDALSKDEAKSTQGSRKVSGGPNDGRTYYELTFETAVAASVRQLERLLSGLVCYRVTTRTGDCPFAGTDADVFVVLRGGGKDTGPLRLWNTGKNDFERGRSDAFILGSTVDVGEAERLTVWYEAGPEAGVFPGWYLEEVVVEKIGDPGKRTFKCGRWLARDEGDRKTVVELVPSQAGAKGA